MQIFSLRLASEKTAFLAIASCLCTLLAGCSGAAAPGFQTSQTASASSFRGAMPQGGLQQTLYVSSYDEGNVTTYSLRGKPKNFSITGLDSPNDVAVDGNGYIYVTNYDNAGSSQSVLAYNPSGT